MKKYFPIVALISLSLMASGCSPEVGSEGWCKQLKEKPKGDWTASEAKDFVTHCIL